MLLNDRASVTPDLEYQVLIYRGNGHYHEKQFRLAAKSFDAALRMRKAMGRFRNHLNTTLECSGGDMFSEEEVRYRLAICLRELGEQNVAISTLQALPAKQRSPKLNMLLAKLLHHGRASNTNEAIASYKEVLRDDPLALDAIDGLLLLGVDGIEVNSLVVNCKLCSE